MAARAAFWNSRTLCSIRYIVELVVHDLIDNRSDLRRGFRISCIESFCCHRPLVGASSSDNPHDIAITYPVTTVRKGEPTKFFSCCFIEDSAECTLDLRESLSTCINCDDWPNRIYISRNQAKFNVNNFVITFPLSCKVISLMDDWTVCRPELVKVY